MPSLDELAHILREQKMKINSGFDYKMWTTIGMFLISVVSAVGAYYKSISDIREEIHFGMYKNTESIRGEVRELYTTKEESKFIQKSLDEIKGDIKEIKNALRR